MQCNQVEVDKDGHPIVRSWETPEAVAALELLLILKAHRELKATFGGKEDACLN